jgi:CRISPR/Cas system-associated exonuclease Cas4 (RecB family)
MIPLELKTGKTIENMDHKAQLLLYSLLLSERTFEGEIPPGVVLYLRNNTMRAVLPKMADLKGILNRRNLMVQPFSKLGIESLPGE